MYHELMRDPDKLVAANIKTVKLIGDAYVPGIIAAAVWSGHRYARELDGPTTDEPMSLRE